MINQTFLDRYSDCHQFLFCILFSSKIVYTLSINSIKMYTHSIIRTEILGQSKNTPYFIRKGDFYGERLEYF